MILSDKSIKAALVSERLKITPLVNENIQPASVDLTLANDFIRFDTHHVEIDPRSSEQYTRQFEVDRYLFLMPNDFVLGSTDEYIAMPDDLAAQVGGKSSLARIGIAIHVTAGFIDPGFCGRITLEIKNMGVLPVRLYPGMKIAQIVFEEMTTPAERPYGSPGIGSKYQGQDTVMASRMHENWSNQ